jgi:hypothetical protein
VIAHNKLKAKTVGARLAHGDSLRVAQIRNKELDLLAASDSAAHGHRFCSCCSFVEKRRVGKWQRWHNAASELRLYLGADSRTGQVADESLEV